MFAPDAEGKLRAPYRTIDGRVVAADDVPSARALRGETVRSDYLVHDPRSGDDRIVNLKAAPIRDDHDRTIGSVVLSRDVTEERQNAEREAWRRRRAECLANLGLEAITVQPQFENLDDTARRVAESVVGTVMIFLYHAQTAELHMVGMGSVAPTAPHVERFREYLNRNPYHAGEGVAGTVFQIGRPLFFSDVRGSYAARIIAVSVVNKSEYKTANVIVSQFTGQYQFQQPYGTQMAAGVVVTIPLVIAVLLFQRRIVEGLTAGGVK